MLKELDNRNWYYAFEYAGETAGDYSYGSPNVTSDGSCPDSIFTREDVKKIYGLREGQNDGDRWLLYGLLKDGRYFYLEAGCDYTGWDCQAFGFARVSLTKKGIKRTGLTEEARKVFGLKDNNIGTIKLKEIKESLEIKNSTESAKVYLYIETGDDGCGDLYVSLKPLDRDYSEYREITREIIEKDCYMGRNEDAKIKICISELCR